MLRNTQPSSACETVCSIGRGYIGAKIVMSDISKSPFDNAFMEGVMSSRETYGQELILDLHGCDAGRFTRRDIEQFCQALCEVIKMERCDLHFWDDAGVPEEEQPTQAGNDDLLQTAKLHYENLMSEGREFTGLAREFARRMELDSEYGLTIPPLGEQASE